MQQILLLMFMGLLAQTGRLSAETPRCVAGNDVRLRSAPSTSASIVGTLFLNDKFVHAEPASEAQTVSGLTDKWYKVYRGCQGMECADYSPAELRNVRRAAGYIFGAFLASCAETNELVRKQLLDTSRPLAERLLFRIVSAAGFQERLLPNGISTKNTSVTHYADILNSQFDWKTDGSNLKIRFLARIRETGQMDVRNIDLQCVYTSLVPKQHNYFELIPAQNSNSECFALIYLSN